MKDKIRFIWVDVLDGHSEGYADTLRFLSNMNWIVGNMQSAIANVYFENLAQRIHYGIYFS